jgi:SEC-C motif-containing protein
MRSRYSAYVLGREDYLLATWHPDFRPRQLTLESDQKWLGLKIRATTRGLATDTAGTVEFVARYKVEGRGFRLHETSRFVREAGRWYYTDGDLHAK